MSLKKKIATILLLIMAISSLMFFAVFKLIVFESFVQIENSRTIDDMHRCFSALNIELKHLDNFVHDWSSWDSAYTFASEQNQGFIDENLGLTVFLDQGLSLIHVYNADSEIVWGKTYDLETKEEIPLDLVQELGPALFSRLVSQKDPARFTSGIILTGIGPLLVSAHPILTSENKGPGNGTMVMGRLFSQETIDLLSEMSTVELKAWSVRDDEIPEEAKGLVDVLNDLQPVRIVHASSDIIHAYSLIRDIDGQPAIIVKATFPRLITQKGTRAYMVGMMFILGTGLLVFLSISAIFGGYVLRPIGRLTENALAISGASQKPVRSDTGRNDEIRVLSKAFEAMVDHLSTSKELYTKLVNTIPDIIVRTDLRGQILFVNDYTLEISGYSREEIEGQNMLMFVPAEDHDRLMKNVSLMMEGQIGPKEYTLIMKDGTRVPFEVNGEVLRSEDGTPFGMVNVCRDISERRRTVEALIESEEKYRQLAETAHDYIVTVDSSFRITYANTVVLQAAGDMDLIGMNLLDFTPEELHDFQKEIMRKRMEGFSDMLSFEWEVLHPDGKFRTFDIKSTLLTDKGKPSGVMFIARDITQRKETENAVRKSEERYRTIFESTATANILVGKDSTILVANNDFAALCGYTKEELEDKISWHAFIHRDDLEKMKNYHEMRRVDPASAPSTYEFRAINREGETLKLLLSTAVIPGTDESIVSMIDITEWKRSEQAKIESEARFEQLAELLPETVYEADINGVFTFVNHTGFDKFGYVQDDIARNLTVFEMIIPADHPRMIETYKKLIRGESVGLSEYTAITKDGDTFPALVHATAIFRDGKPVGHRGFIVDISEKKKMENQLVRAQKMESIGTLAGGIAHDFNNLLMGILGNISLILFQIDEKDPIHDRLKSVEELVQRGSDLTKQLLGFARGGKYEVKPTDLGALVEQSSELFGRAKKEISIHHVTQEDLWSVEVDQGQIEQVILNIFMNAWFAMPHGGDLFISEENVELDGIDVSPYEIAPGRFVKVTITDTGTGMDEATKSRIFEPFFSTRERGRGTGLGLASAYGIVKNHGGFIHVESEKDKGSSFMIYLPASDKMIEIIYKAPEEVSRGEETILVIDDEEMILEISSKMLEELGYKVISASGGEKGVHLYKENKDRIDLVILDMIMPDFSGKDSFEAIRRINPAAAVLLSSGYSLDSQAKEIMARGCRGFIQKPFTLASLSKKLREVLDRQ
ncbi:MAG TPA: PAS domain S-box protein [Deltaproteobacteria bacterium]|nr:PAS domain S-box protein [Deltaproteobacteria bacterium]